MTTWWERWHKFVEDGAFFNQGGFKPVWFVHVVDLWMRLQAVLMPLGWTLLWLALSWLARWVAVRLLARIGRAPCASSLRNGAVHRDAGRSTYLPVARAEAASATRRSGRGKASAGATALTLCAELPSSRLAYRVSVALQGVSILYRVLQGYIVAMGALQFLQLTVWNEPRTAFRSTGRIPSPLCRADWLEAPTAAALEERFRTHWLPEYLQRVQAVQWARARDATELPRGRTRVLLYRASCDGLGNRFAGMLSAFFLAYLSDRAFLVDWSSCASVVHGSLDDLIRPPFDWDARRFLQATGARQHVRGAPAEGGTDVLRAFQSLVGVDGVRRLATAYCRPCPWRRPITDLQTMLCADPRDDDVPVIDFYGTHWSGAVLQHNPALRQRSCARFGADVFGILARTLLQPQEAVQRLADTVRPQLAAADVVVGLQVRRKDSYGISARMEETMWRCARQVAELHWRQRRQQQRLPDNGSVAPAPPRQRPRVALFIASDHAASREALRHANLPADTDAAVVSLDAPLLKTSVQSMQYALAEMYLLSRSDELVISPYSSFGSVAHGWGSRPPWVMLRTGQCMRALSSMPCDVYWFGVQRLPCFDDRMLSSEMVNQEYCYG